MNLPRGVLDTCVLIEIGGGRIDGSQLPDQQTISAVTLGELSVGPLVARDALERARRQARLQAIEAVFAE